MKMPLIDLHCDTISRIMKNPERAELARNSFHVDLEKLEQSHSVAQFFALFINMKQQLEKDSDYLEYCLHMLDRFYLEIAANAHRIALARNDAEMESNMRKGLLSAFLTIEEGGVLKGSLSHLRNFYRLGVRLLTLTWNYPNEIGFPNLQQEYREKGLTDFGKELVVEMNRLGMLIDVSHLSDQGFYDVSQISSQPFVASHSNARALKGHPRNLTDDMIRVLADKGGIIGINFYANFLGEGGTSKIDDIVRHIRHIRNIGGIDVLAIGTDFDGISGCMEIENIGQIDKLCLALEHNGFHANEIDKIFCHNARRIIRDVLR